MPLIKPDMPPDTRIGNGLRPKTKVEDLVERIAAKQREIRLLEIELDRTDHNELAEKTDSKLEE